MEQRKEAQRRDEQRQQHIKTANNVNIKTNDNNKDYDKDNNGVAGGGAAA
jgi:hypothetical protein